MSDNKRDPSKKNRSRRGIGRARSSDANASAASRKRSVWPLFLITAFICLALGAGYIVWLDASLRQKFESHRWTLPARVYARPLELFVGQTLGLENLRKELMRLRYRQDAQGPGSYRIQGQQIIFHTRGFTFWDQQETPNQYHLVFNEKKIAFMRDANGKAQSLLRLEPLLIANIYPAHTEDRNLVRVQDVPPVLLASLLVVEDRYFKDHHGIQVMAIVRAMFANLKAGGTVQGGSTLTQQLVKNFFLSSERTLRRKALEALMAILLELHYSKSEILETYLNEVYFGQDGERAIHGIGLAAEHYFGRDLNDLKTEHIALLVGLIKGPSYYDPRRNPKAALERRNVVINLMLQEGLVDAVEAQRARLSSLDLIDSNDIQHTRYPAFIDLVKRQLQTDYSDDALRSEGLRIFTTLDPQVQAVTEQVLSRGIATLNKTKHLKTKNQLQAAALVTTVNNGEVLAIVGSAQPNFPGFNRALDAKRQIGSLIKPVVYLAALETGRYHAASMLQDQPVSLRGPKGQDWSPQNYDKQFHGEVLLYKALAQSYNAATVQLGMGLGVKRIADWMHKLGVQSNIPLYPSLFLGAVDLSPYEVTQMYQTFASNGFYTPLRAVREVATANGARLKRYPLALKPVIKSDVAYVLNHLMQRVFTEGTAQSVYARMAALQPAGKTGTSDTARDAWFAGYTGEHLAVVWVGRDDHGAANISGGSAALPLWTSIFEQVDSTPLERAMPANVQALWVDAQSGGLSAAKCDNVVQLPFIIGVAPIEEAKCQGQSFWQRLFN
ncbi:MAG: penicillin-binding protein 1B [Gammaproteobacteria bacterium]|nr:penicillin-binding protein 1B [Gammaproteobacteria bacterium]